MSELSFLLFFWPLNGLAPSCATIYRLVVVRILRAFQFIFACSPICTCLSDAITNNATKRKMEKFTEPDCGNFESIPNTSLRNFSNFFDRKKRQSNYLKNVLIYIYIYSYEYKEERRGKGSAPLTRLPQRRKSTYLLTQRDSSTVKGTCQGGID